MMTKTVLEREELLGVTNYIPVNVVPRYSETVLCDLNAMQFPFDIIPRVGKFAFLFLWSIEVRRG